MPVNGNMKAPTKSSFRGKYIIMIEKITIMMRVACIIVSECVSGVCDEYKCVERKRRSNK